MITRKTLEHRHECQDVKTLKKVYSRTRGCEQTNSDRHICIMSMDDVLSFEDAEHISLAPRYQRLQHQPGTAPV